MIVKTITTNLIAVYPGQPRWAVQKKH